MYYLCVPAYAVVGHGQVANTSWLNLGCVGNVARARLQCCSMLVYMCTIQEYTLFKKTCYITGPSISCSQLCEMILSYAWMPQSQSKGPSRKSRRPFFFVIAERNVCLDIAAVHGVCVIRKAPAGSGCVNWTRMWEATGPFHAQALQDITFSACTKLLLKRNMHLKFHTLLWCKKLLCAMRFGSSWQSCVLCVVPKPYLV